MGVSQSAVTIPESKSESAEVSLTVEKIEAPPPDTDVKPAVTPAAQDTEADVKMEG